MRHVAVLLTIGLLVFGCGKSGSDQFGGLRAEKHSPDFDEEAAVILGRLQTEGLAYDEPDMYRAVARSGTASETRREGTGFNPEGLSGLEGQMPPAFRDMSNQRGEAGQRLPEQEENSSEMNAITGDQAERKLVMRADIAIRVDNLDEADASVTALMETHGAYAASSYATENTRRYSIRVPSAAYRAFLAGTDSLGRLQSRSESAEDVTLRYYDLEGRLATQRELLRTFQSYLGRARNIEEILSVERRIAELQNELDWTGKELRGLANRVDYSTVELSLNGSPVTTPYRGPTFMERMRELFSGFGGFLAGGAVILTGLVIYGIPVLLLIVFLFWILFGKVGLIKRLWRVASGKKEK